MKHSCVVSIILSLLTSRCLSFAQRCAAHWSSSLTTTSCLAATTTMSFLDFLSERKKNPTNHVVIGNEAGDADSILSALCLAYVEEDKTPIVSIRKADLQSQRPETTLLLKLAGVSLDSLIYLDDPWIRDKVLDVTLVDHNELTVVDKAASSWKVVEIVDHHYDHGAHLDTCDKRIIAFANDQALVASTCTLVVERLLESDDKKKQVCLESASLGVLLLGTILLDSVNMSKKAGKGTERDQKAIDTLLQQIQWNNLSPFAKQVLEVPPSTTALFDKLQQAKFDPDFWNSLSVIDALRLDYKQFIASRSSFGVSTVLMKMDDFRAKEDLPGSIDAYMNQVGVDFLAVMLTFTKDSHLCRQLVLCGRSSFPLDNLEEFLMKQEELGLERVDREQGLQGLSVRYFEQHNSKLSRKQVAPILMQFFETM